MPPKVKPIAVALAGETLSLVEEKPATKARPRKPTKARLIKLETDILSLPPEEQEEVLQRITNQRALLALAQQKGTTSDGGLNTTLEVLELDQLRYELGDVLQRQAELRLKEKKVKALIVKKQRQIVLVNQNTSSMSAIGTEDHPQNVGDDTHDVAVRENDAAPFPPSAIATSSHPPISWDTRRATNSSLWNLSHHIDLNSTRPQRVDVIRDCVLVLAEDIGEAEPRRSAPRAVVDVDNDAAEAVVGVEADRADAHRSEEVTATVSEAEAYFHWWRWVQQVLAQLAAERDGGPIDVDVSTPPITTPIPWREISQILQRIVAEEAEAAAAVAALQSDRDLYAQWCDAQTSLAADVAAIFQRLDEVPPSEAASPSTHGTWSRVRQATVQLWLHQNLRWRAATLSSAGRVNDTDGVPSGRLVTSEKPATVEAEQRTSETKPPAAVAVVAGACAALSPSPPVIDLFSEDVRGYSEPPRKKQAVGSRLRPPLHSDGSASTTTAATPCIIDLASPALRRTAAAAAVTNGSAKVALDVSVAEVPSPSHSTTIRTTPLFERLKKISGRQLRRPPTIPEAASVSSSRDLPMVLDDADDDNGDVVPPLPRSTIGSVTPTAATGTEPTAVASVAALSSPQRLDRLCQDYGLTALRQQPSLLRHVVARLVPPSAGAASAAGPLNDSLGAHEGGVHPSGGGAASAAAVAATETALPFEQRSQRTIASFLQHPTQQSLLQRILTFDVIDVDDVITAARVFWYQHRPTASTTEAASAVTLPDDWLQFFSVDGVRQALDAMHVFYKLGAANAKRSDGHRKRKAKGNKPSTSAV